MAGLLWAIGNSVKEVIFDPFKEPLTKFVKKSASSCGIIVNGDFCYTIFSDKDPITFKAVIGYIANDTRFRKYMRYTTTLPKDPYKNDEKEVLRIETGYSENTIYVQVRNRNFQLKIERKRLENSSEIPVDRLDVKLITPDDTKLNLADARILDTFIKNALKNYYDNRGLDLQIWRLSNLSWHPMQVTEKKRDMETVILKKGYKEQITKALNKYIKLQDEKKHSKCVFMFYGSPGSGKTTLANAIATHVKINHDTGNIYIISLGTPGLSDTNLPIIIDKVPRRNVILFEDFDVIMNRSMRGNMITEEGFTNVLDGIGCSMKGKIAILNTNHPNILSPRMMRSGRIDVKLKICYPDLEQIKKYIMIAIDQYFPDVGDGTKNIIKVKLVRHIESVFNRYQFKMSDMEALIKEKSYIVKYENGNIIKMLDENWFDSYMKNRGETIKTEEKTMVIPKMNNQIIKKSSDYLPNITFEKIVILLILIKIIFFI